MPWGTPEAATVCAVSVSMRFTVMWLTDGQEPTGAAQIRLLTGKFSEKIDHYYQYIYDTTPAPATAVDHLKAFTDGLGVDRVTSVAASSAAGAAPPGMVALESAFASAAVDEPIHLRVD